MSRVHRVVDERGEHTLSVTDFPLAVGGAGVADIVLPGCRDDLLVAQIAYAEGHAYLQPADGVGPLFHNGEHLQASAWLKSGDQVQFEAAVVSWQVHGDQVDISVARRTAAPPPLSPPPPREAPAARAPLPVVEAGAAATGHRGLKRLVAVVFALLLLVAGFLLMSVPLHIDVEPEPQVLALEGFPPPLVLGERHLAWPGSYRLQASLPGYYDLSEPVSVSRDGARELVFSMRELPGQISLRVLPGVDYQLQVDGEPVAVDKGVARIARGERLLSIHTERYLVAEQALAVAGFGQSQSVDFRLQPAWAVIGIDSLPTGAGVSVDGTPVGETPLSMELLQGVRRISLQKPLFKTVELEHTVVAGQNQTLAPVELVPSDGRLLLDSTPAAVTVQVEGRYRGVTPLTLELPSGRPLQLRLAKPGFSAALRTINLAPEEEQSLHLQLQPEYGTLFISSHPVDAELRVDGKAMGKATQRLRLTTRTHRVEISKPGYMTHSTTVTPRAGTSQTLDVTLKSAAQAKREATPAVIRTPAGQTLRLVRPGEAFRMGASRREAGRRANENPRTVQLTRPFYFAAREVSNAEYRQFRAAHTSGSAEGAHLDADRQPVVNISWDDAARYCNWLSRQAGLPEAYRESGGSMQLVTPPTSGYRMPTEAEWVYVARVLAHNPPARYPWAGSYPPAAKVGNFADARIGDTLAEVVPGYDDGYRGSAPIGSFAAFPEGFYDLGGNVAEWVSDYYSVYPGVGDTLVTDPLGPSSGEHRVVKGSSWRHGNITELRLSYRDYSRKPRDDLGFRLARYAD